MKKLILPLLILACFGFKYDGSNPPFVMAQATSVYTLLSSDTLQSIACDPACQPITYAWTKVAGPGSPAMINATTSNLILTGLQTGFYIYKSTVTTTSTGLSASDTVGFLVNIPIQLPPITVYVHDTTKVRINVAYPLYDGHKFNYVFVDSSRQ
jgi:hypothetical protein